MLYFRPDPTNRLSYPPKNLPFRSVHKLFLRPTHKDALIGPPLIPMLLFVNTLYNFIYNMYFVKSLLYKYNLVGTLNFKHEEEI